MRQDNRDRRLTYQVAKELCKENGLDVKAANPAYGYLRLETPFKDGQTAFQFPLLQNQTYNGYNQNPTEQRLTLQDNFVVGSKYFGLYWWNTATNLPVSKLITGFTAFNTPQLYNEGDVTPVWKNGPYVLNGNYSGLMNEIWQSGWMRYSMDYNVIIPRWDCLQHFYIPRTQETTNYRGVDPATEYAFAWNGQQAEGLSDGFVPMEPNIVLSGAKNTTIDYNLPFALSYASMGWNNALVTAGTVQPRLVCIYRGVLLQNTTNVK